MNQSVQVSELPVDRLEQAWPLVREITDGVSLDGWCAFARNMLDPASPRRGILVAQRKRTIRGLVTYETVDDLVRGRELLLRNPVVLDIAMGEPIAASLLRGCLEVAERTQCESLCLEVSSPMAWIGEVWQREAREAGAGVRVRVVDTQDASVPPPDSCNVVPVVTR